MPMTCSSGESANNLNILDLPGSIEQLLDEGLRESGLPGAATAKFDLEGHPDLLVRLNEGYDLLEMKLSLHAANQAVRYGVNVLPSQVVSRQGKPYVITQRVQGGPLLDALAAGPGDELLAATDAHWCNLGRYVVGQMKKRKSVAWDIYGAEQCMFGTTATDAVPRLWMVDLPIFSDSFEFEPDSYNSRLRDWIEALADIETVTGRPLDSARSVIEDAFTLSLEETSFGPLAIAQMRTILK